jgi:hypothetical protein
MSAFALEAQMLTYGGRTIVVVTAKYARAVAAIAQANYK